MHSLVLVRGHGPKDSPGINYHLIRGACDFIREETFGRRNRRSNLEKKMKKIKIICHYIFHIYILNIK